MTYQTRMPEVGIEVRRYFESRSHQTLRLPPSSYLLSAYSSSIREELSFVPFDRALFGTIPTKRLLKVPPTPNKETS